MKKLLLSTLMLGTFSFTMSAQTAGSAEAPLSVSEFLEQGIPDEAVADTYVEGYIVGYVDGAKIAEGAHFDLSAITASNNTNLLLAGSSSETNVSMCIPVQLPAGTIRDALNLAANPENLGHGVVLCGSHEKFFGVNGLKAVKSYSWVGEAPEKPEIVPPTEAETGTKEKPLTVTEYLALGTPLSPVSGTWLTGYIVGSVTDKSLDSAELGASANSSVSNILVAATTTPSSIADCIPVQLPQGDIRDVLNLKDNPDNVGKTVVLCGTRENYFSVLGMKSPTEYTLDGEVVTPTLPEGVFYKGLTSNADGWTLNDGTLPEGLNYVWSWDNIYGLKAQAYVSGKRYATDIYAVSPVIDLSNAKTAQLSCSQAINYASTGVDGFTFNVREENGEWSALTMSEMPAGNNWTFVESTADLNAWVGKKIQIGLRYTSTTEVAATWEIKNLIVEGEANGDGVAEVVAEIGVYALNGNIVAPEGARVFNLQGIETGTQSLPAGIYVVVVANKAVKVLVK